MNHYTYAGDDSWKNAPFCKSLNSTMDIRTGYGCSECRESRIDNKKIKIVSPSYCNIDDIDWKNLPEKHSWAIGAGISFEEKIPVLYQACDSGEIYSVCQKRMNLDLNIKYLAPL